MATIILDVLEPVQDVKKSIESIQYTPQAVTASDTVYIKNAFDNKNNSLQITIANTTTSSGSGVDKAFTLAAGNRYPNKVLGDHTETIGGGKSITFMVTDISRFERVESLTESGTTTKYESVLKLTFAASFTGTITAVAKRAGVMPKTQQDALGY